MIKVLDTVESYGLDRYALGFWNYVDLRNPDFFDRMDEQQVRDWAEIGVSVMQGPEGNFGDPKQFDKLVEILDWCQKHDIKMIISDQRVKPKLDPEGKKVLASYKETLKKVFSQYENHPAIFGFHVGDEPKPGPRTFLYGKCVKYHREVAPQWHPFMNQNAFWPEWNLHVGYETAVDYEVDFVHKSNSDILSWDCYTQMWYDGTHPTFGETGLDKYFDNLRIFRAASVKTGCPFWNTPLTVGHMQYRCPNYYDLMWQFNTTVCYGANGIQYFFYYARDSHANYRFSPIDELWEKTQTWHDLRKIHKLFNQRYGDLFNHLVSTKVMFIPKTYGNGRIYRPDGIIANIEVDKWENGNRNHPFMIGEFVDRQGRRYAMIVNNSTTKNVKVDITFAGRDVRVFSWKNGREYEGPAYSGGKQSHNEKGVTIGHWMAPGAEVVYRVQSTSANNEPILFE